MTSRRSPVSAAVAVLPNGTPVTLVRPDGAKRPMLGTREPEDSGEVARRIRALEAWGAGGPPARRRPDNAIEQALPLRTRTILSDGLPPDVAELVNGRR